MSPAALPAGARRLFAHDAAADLDLDRHRPHLLARLLEEGERDDLAWLAGEVSEADLAAWFAARGGRALSRRSRAFWRLVLAVEPSPEAPAARELWPL